MGFAAVYQCLQELFPQLDARLLKAVAIEHPKDADAAVEVIHSEVLPHMVQKAKFADSRSENMSSLGQSDGEVESDEQASLSRRRHLLKRATVNSLEMKDVSNGTGNAANSAGNSVDADSTLGDEGPFYDANDGNDHPCRAVDNEALIVSESSPEMSVVQADKSSEVLKHSDLHPCDAIDDNEVYGNADGEELILLGMEKVQEPMPVSKKVRESGPTNGTTSSSGLVPLTSYCESGRLSSSLHIDSKGSSYSDAGVGEKSSNLETFSSEVENSDVELALLSPQERSSEAPSCVSDVDTDAHGNNCADGNVEFESSAVAQKLGLSCTDTLEMDDDPLLNMTRSGQICSVELLEEIIKDAKNNKLMDQDMSIEVDGRDEMSSLMELPFHGVEEVASAIASAIDKVRVPSSRPLLGKKQVDRSEVWDNFSKILDVKTNKTRVKCNHCGDDNAYIVDNGMSSMRMHLRKCKKYPHADKRQTLFAPHNKDVAGKVGGDTGCGSVLTTWKFDQEHCRYMLARMIIIDEQPFSTVERVGFRDFVTELQPLFQHLSQFTVARDCMKLYLSEKTCLKTYFGKLNSRIALTIDLWSSIQNLKYLCLTAHFIDENWKLHKRIINFVMMHSHKGREIGKMVEKCIYEWGIEKKLSTITVGSACSNDVAVGYLKDKFSREKLLILNGEVLHVRCTAYILNVIVMDGLHEVRDSIARIRNVVRYVKSSPMRAETFQSCIESERITYEDSVCLDVATRWSSTYLMLETAIKLRKAFERMELDINSPQNEDWENAIILSKFLKQFYDATKQMSGCSYVTSNDYFERIALLYKYLNDAANSLDPKFHAMGTKMKEKFEKYYGSLDKVNMMVLIAIALDPTKKLTYVKFCYGQIYDDEGKIDEMHDNVKHALKSLFAFYEKSFVGSSSKRNTRNVGGSSVSSSGGGSNADDNEGNNEYDIQAWRKSFLHAKKKVFDDKKSELDWYLEAESEDVLNLDLLMWWKSTGSKYKILSLMARDVLSIPVTTVASELTFSTSSRVLDGFRSSLTPRVVEGLICTQDWLRAGRMPINVEECIKNAEKFELDLDCLTEDIIIGK